MDKELRQPVELENQGYDTYKDENDIPLGAEALNMVGHQGSVEEEVEEVDGSYNNFNNNQFCGA